MRYLPFSKALAGLIFSILGASCLGQSQTTLSEVVQGSHIEEGLREFESGKLLLDSNRFELAKIHILNSLKLMAGSDHPTVSKAHNNLGRAYFFLGQYDSSLVHYRKAATLNIDSGDSISLAQNLINVGNVYFLEARHELALETYMSALKTCESLHLKHETSMLLNNIGGIHLKQNNLQEALDFFRQSAILKKELSDTLGQSRVYNNISEIMATLGRRHEAKEYLLMSIKLKEKINDRRGLSFAYNNLAELLLNGGNWNEAIRIQHQALEIQESLGEEAAIMYTRLRLADYLKEKDPEQAQTYLDLPRARELGSLDQLSELYRIQSAIHEAKGNYKSGLEAFKMHKLYQDSIINREKAAQLAELQSNYELDKKDQEIMLLSTENQLQQTQAARQQLISKGLIGGTILLLILFSVAYSSYRINKRNSRLLAKKNVQVQQALEEREVLLKEVHHRVKNNLQIIASLLNLQTELRGDKEAVELLRMGQDRIQTMSIIHERLYQSDDLARITFKSFLEELMDYFRQTYTLGEDDRINFSSKVENVTLAMDKLVPCGLILNELITNSIKYAFPEGQVGKITINGSLVNDNSYLLEIMDSGTGPKEKIKIQDRSSLGLSLVRNLVRQMKGVIEEVRENGFGFRITFEISAVRP